MISSYVVANGETWRRGVALSFASAILQALVAVAIVGVAAVLLGATRRAMDGTVYWIEVVSYGLIAMLGLRLLWVKGRAFIAAWHKYRGVQQRLQRRMFITRMITITATRITPTIISMARPAATTTTTITTTTPRPGATRTRRSRRSWPVPAAGSAGCRRSSRWDLRPCSGAILVLVFALAQGLFWAGVAATFIMGIGTAITVAAIAALAVGARGLAQRFADARPGPGMLVLRGIEVAAALLVLCFGVALLMGYVASERMFAA